MVVKSWDLSIWEIATTLRKMDTARQMLEPLLFLRRFRGALERRGSSVRLRSPEEREGPGAWRREG